MKNLYDYNDSDNELDAGFLILAFLIGLILGGAAVLVYMIY